MRRNLLFAGVAAGVFLTTLLHADCAKDNDHRSNKNSGLLITDFIISGTQRLSSTEPVWWSRASASSRVIPCCCRRR